MNDFNAFIDAIRAHDLTLVKRLFKEEFIDKRTSNGRTALHWATSDSNADIVRYLLFEGFDIEAEMDLIGCRSIHIAARMGNIDMMTALMDRECSLDCKDHRRRTPLDVARKRNHQECILLFEETKAKKIELQQQRVKKNRYVGMNIPRFNKLGRNLAGPNIINEKGNMDVPENVNVHQSILVPDMAMPQQELLMLPRNVMIQQIMRQPTNLELWQCNSLSTIMDAQTGKTLLDVLLINSTPLLLEKIKSKPVDEQEINEWVSLRLRRVDAESYRLLHECLLSRCIRQEYTRGFERLCTPDIVNKDTLFMGQSTLESVAQSGLKTWVNHVLRRLSEVDETWTRAENIATKKGHTEVAKLISSRKEYLGRRQMRGYSRLHIAVLDNTSDMIEYLLEKDIANADEGDKNIGTALSLAYESDFMDCVESLQNFNVNSNTTDWLSRSPLNFAICNRIEGDQVKYLIEKSLDSEVKDYLGLRVLDRSIINDCRGICEQLLEKNVKLNKLIKINSNFLDYDLDRCRQPCLPITKQESVYTLCLKFNKMIYPCLLKIINKSIVNLTDGDKNTLLHLSAVLLLPDLCSQLIPMSANIDSENKMNNTPLLELLEQNRRHNFDEIKVSLMKTVNILINAGTSFDTETELVHRVLEIANEYNSEILLLAIIRNIKNITFLKNDLFQTWFDKKYLVLIKEVIDRIEKSVLQPLLTTDCIKGIVKDADMNLVMSLYDNSHKSVREYAVESILYKAAITNDATLFEILIGDKIHADSCLRYGESLVHYLISERKERFIEIILLSQNSPMLMEKKNTRNKLPLHSCIEYEYWDLIDGIIHETSSVDTEDDDGNTPLSLLFSKISAIKEGTVVNRLVNQVKTLIKSSADINKVNRHNKAAIEYCTNRSIKSVVQAFARNHPPRPALQFQVTAPAPLTEPVTESDNISPRPPLGAATAPQICEICVDLPRDCALNCGHIFCQNCAEREVYCYLCRTPITDRRIVYL